MRLDYVHPFIDSAVHVLTWFTGTPVECSAIALRQSSLQCKEVVFMIKVTGEAEIDVNLEMNRETALALAGSMSGMVVQDIYHVAPYCLLDMANQVALKAVTHLNDRGYAFELTPALVCIGAHRSRRSLGIETVVISLLAGGAGEVNLNMYCRPIKR
jgi:chemotaxis protein CheX